MRGLRSTCVKACFEELDVKSELPHGPFAAHDFGLSGKQVLKMQSLGLIRRVLGGRVGNERAWKATDDYWRMIG